MGAAHVDQEAEKRVLALPEKRRGPPGAALPDANPVIFLCNLLKPPFTCASLGWFCSATRWCLRKSSTCLRWWLLWHNLKSAYLVDIQQMLSNLSLFLSTTQSFSNGKRKFRNGLHLGCTSACVLWTSLLICKMKIILVLLYCLLRILNDGTSLVAQWLRIHLPMQGARVRALVQEAPTCRGATKRLSHNYRACTLEPMSHTTEPTCHNYWSPRA